MRINITYTFKDGRITSWVKMKDGYYVFNDVWRVGRGNKRKNIEQTLREYLETVSHHTNYPPCNSPTYTYKIESDILMKRLRGFRSNLFELERNLLKELEGMVG